MGAVHVLDRYYLSITLLITVAYQLLFFIIAFTLQIDKLTDFAGGTNFILLAILTLSFSEARDNARNIVVSVLLIVWAARLAGYLFYRILNTGTDHRFNNMRHHFIKFGTFWVLQILWVWAVSLPITVLNSPGVTRYSQPSFGTGRDIAGIIIYTIGLVMESVSDAQRYRFRERHGNDGAPCDIGLFKWSRHPNYFGEIIVHFGEQLLIIWFHLIVTNRQYSNIYDRSVTCGIWLYERRCPQSDVCYNTRPSFPNFSSSLCIRSTTL
jgi:steroid 5-alpha reductase family enzyme